jgi:hypothetical protein
MAVLIFDTDGIRHQSADAVKPARGLADKIAAAHFVTNHRGHL